MPPPRINYWTGFASIEKVFILWVIPAVQRLVETQLTFHSGDSYTDSGFTVKGRLPSSDWPLGNPWGWLLSRLSDYMARLSHSKIQRQCIRDLHFAEAGSTVDHAILPHGNSFTEQIGENFMPKWGHHYRNNSLLIISGDSKPANSATAANIAIRVRNTPYVAFFQQPLRGLLWHQRHHCHSWGPFDQRIQIRSLQRHLLNLQPPNRPALLNRRP